MGRDAYRPDVRGAPVTASGRREGAAREGTAARARPRLRDAVDRPLGSTAQHERRDHLAELARAVAWHDRLRMAGLVEPVGRELRAGMRRRGLAAVAGVDEAAEGVAGVGGVGLRAVAVDE